MKCFPLSDHTHCQWVWGVGLKWMLCLDICCFGGIPAIGTNVQFTQESIIKQLISNNKSNNNFNLMYCIFLRLFLKDIFGMTCNVFSCILLVHPPHQDDAPMSCLSENNEGQLRGASYNKTDVKTLQLQSPCVNAPTRASKLPARSARSWGTVWNGAYVLQSWQNGTCLHSARGSGPHA